MEPFNVSEYLLDRRLAAGDGGREALRAAGVGVTYAELHDLVCRFAAGLRDLGVRPEERVALVLFDTVELVATLLAAMRIGAIPLPLNSLLPGRDLALTVAEARARVAVVSADRTTVAAELVEGAPELERVIVAGEGEAPAPARAAVVRWDELASADPAAGSPYATWDDSPGFWLCTSGTTGRPKLAMHRHADLRITAEGYAREVLDIGPDDRCFSVAPLFHAYGLGNALGFPAVGGCDGDSRGGAAPEAGPGGRGRAGRAADAVLRRADVLRGAARGRAAGDTFASVRHGVSAGEALPAELFVRFRERFGVEILDGIGSTEMTHIYVSNRPGRCRPGSSGTVVGGYRVRLADDERQRVPPGTPGQLWVSGDSAATGYWCRTEATRRASRASGFAAATCTSSRRTAFTRIWAAPTTCSRSAASGSPRPRWKPC